MTLKDKLEKYIDSLLTEECFDPISYSSDAYYKRCEIKAEVLEDVIYCLKEILKESNEN